MNINQIVDIGGYGLVLLTIICCAVGLGMFIWHMRQYKHKFRIKKLTGTKTIVIDDRAKEFKDKHGVIWWKLLKRKDVIQVPPADCLDVTDKGKHSVEAYYSDESGYQYEKSAAKCDLEELKELGTQYKQVQTKTYWSFLGKQVWQREKTPKGKYVFIEDRCPSVQGTDILGTKQKVIMVNQLEKAKARKGWSLTEHIPLIIGAGFLLLFGTIMFIFLPDLLKEIGNVAGKLDATGDKLDKTATTMQEMIQKKQIIPAGMTVAEAKAKQVTSKKKLTKNNTNKVKPPT